MLLCLLWLKIFPWLIDSVPEVQRRIDPRHELTTEDVSRGFVNWSLADAERGPRSTGIIEPERISEVVSDVVESQSGYLDVGFDVPSGGAFRVIDVIITEAPRFAQ